MSPRAERARASLNKGALGVLSIVACAACGQGTSQQAPDGGAPALAAKEPVRCFDLPGAVRTRIMASADGKTLYYAERTWAGEAQRFDLVALDLGTGKTSVILRDVGTEIASAGDGKFVFLRPFGEPEPALGAPDRRPEAPPTRLYAGTVGGSEPVALSGEDVRATSFAVDAKAGVVYFATVAPAASSAEMRKVPLSGGASTVVGAGAVYAVVDGGAALIGTGRGSAGWELQKIPTAGGAPLWRVPSGSNVQVMESAIVYLRREATSSTVVSAGLADGKVATAEGTQPDDIPLVGGAPGFVARKGGDTWTTLLLEQGKLVPKLVTKGAAIHGVVPLAGGSFAVLATHDTDGDGEISKVLPDDHDDESDVCVLSPAGAEPLAVPDRSAPKALVAAVPRLQALLAEPDLAGGKLRFVRAATLVVADVPDVGPADPEALRSRVKELQKKVTEQSGRPDLGVSLRYGKSHRHATSLWSARLGRFRAWVGVGDMVMGDKDSAEVEVQPGYSTKTTIETAPGAPSKFAIDLGCSGKVKNLTGAPLALQAECRVYSPFRFVGSPWTTKRGPSAPPSLDPGATGTYEVRLPTIIDGNMRRDTRFFAGEKELAALDAKAYDHVKDWLAAIERVRQKTGALPHLGATHAPSVDYDPHDQPAFDEPPGFAALDRKKQEAVAAAISAEVSAHFTKNDGSIVPEVVLYNDGGYTFTILAGKLKKRGE